MKVLCLYSYVAREFDTEVRASGGRMVEVKSSEDIPRVFDEAMAEDCRYWDRRGFRGERIISGLMRPTDAVMTAYLTRNNRAVFNAVADKNRRRVVVGEGVREV
jgi:hypothetical protein